MASNLSSGDNCLRHENARRQAPFVERSDVGLLGGSSPEPPATYDARLGDIAACALASNSSKRNGNWGV